jgi:hypothetical protein
MKKVRADRIWGMLATILFSLSSHVLSKSYKIKIHKTIILSVMYGCERWSLTLREEHSSRVYESRLLRRIFGPKKEEVAGEDCIMRSFITCILHCILFR